MADADVLFLSVRELGGRLRRREISPVELTELCLKRLDTIGRDLNCVATLTPELAREQARHAEAEILRGEDRGPLHGIPYGAKDLLDTAGIRTTWGARPYADRVPGGDATVIRLLREAGAILVAKLSMVELAGGLGYHFGTASLQGPMRNPWNRECWTGGSSSGSAAAVAAGLVPFAIGTETWGSILCPSAFCGVTGLRPTYGRVSRHGAMALSWTMDKIGPLAHSVEDARTVLTAIAGPDPEDSSASAAALEWRRAAGGLKGVRAALLTADYGKHGEPEAGQAFERAVADLRGAGLALEEVLLPDLPFEEAAIVFVQAEAACAFEPLFRSGDVRKLADERAPLQYEVARAISATDYIRAMRLRGEMQRALNVFFEKYDVVVSPNFLKTAPGVTQDFDTYFSGNDKLGGAGNLAGLPAAAVPMGFGRERMPVGFQVVAAPFDEAMAVRVAAEYQRHTHWHRERPPLA